MLMLHRDRASGVASSFVNFIVMIGGAFFQFFVGFMLDAFWKGKSLHGVQIFSDVDWKIAMTIFPLTFLIAFFLSFFLREYYHEEY